MKRKSVRISRAARAVARAEALLLLAYEALDGTRCPTERWEVDLQRATLALLGETLKKRARRAKRRGQ